MAIIKRTVGTLRVESSMVLYCAYT